jgi:hypothetical protein
LTEEDCKIQYLICNVRVGFDFGGGTVMRERSIFGMIALVIMGLVVSGGIYYYRDSISAPFRKAAPDVTAQRSPDLSAAPAPKARRAEHKEPAVEEDARASEAPPDPLSQAQARPRAVPGIADIPARTPFPEIVARFGQPDAMATWSYEGNLNRKMIYSSKTESLEINVQNGYVVSARN